MSEKRSFGTIRKLPSGRFQARYTASNGAVITAPGTFAAKIHAETWLGDRKREIDANLWDPSAATRTNVCVCASCLIAAGRLLGLSPRVRPLPARQPSSVARRRLFEAGARYVRRRASSVGRLRAFPPRRAPTDERKDGVHEGQRRGPPGLRAPTTAVRCMRGLSPRRPDRRRRLPAWPLPAPSGTDVVHVAVSDPMTRQRPGCGAADHPRERSQVPSEGAATSTPSPTGPP